MENILLPKQKLKNKTNVKGSYDIIPILGSSARYRESRSCNGTIDSHWALTPLMRSVTKVSVTLWLSLQRRCKMFCMVCFYELAFCRQCVFVLWTSCLLAKEVNHS